MQIVEYPNGIKDMRRDITYLSDDLLHIAQQLEILNLNNEGLVESMRKLSKMILDYDNNVLRKYERIITKYEDL